MRLYSTFAPEAPKIFGRAFVRHVDDVDFRGQLEAFTGIVCSAAYARRGKVDVAMAIVARFSPESVVKPVVEDESNGFKP